MSETESIRSSSTSPAPLSRKERINELLAYKRRDLMEMAKVYAKIPGTWAKPRLADVIVDGQDGINSIRGGPECRRINTPYSERAVDGVLYIHNRTEGYSRRIRQTVDGRGCLSSSLQFPSKYGTTTVVTRISRDKVDEYQRDLQAGTAGLTGQLMNKDARNSGVQTLAAAFLQMHSTPSAPAAIAHAQQQQHHPQSRPLSPPITPPLQHGIPWEQQPRVYYPAPPSAIIHEPNPGRHAAHYQQQQQRQEQQEQVHALPAVYRHEGPPQRFERYASPSVPFMHLPPPDQSRLCIPPMYNLPTRVHQ